MNEFIKTGYYEADGMTNSFNFKTSLSTYEKLSFVSNVTGLVVGDDYYSLAKDLFFNFMIVTMFTDIEIYDYEDNRDDAKVVINKADFWVNETNVVDIVKSNMDYGLLEELQKAVEDNIEYKTGIHKNPFYPVFDSLSKLLDTVENKLANVDVDGMMEMANVISGLTGELTPEKMLDAYANSDIFKNKYKELLEDKKEHDAKIDKLVKDKENVLS